MMQNAGRGALTTRRSSLFVQSQRGYCLQLLKQKKQVPLWIEGLRKVRGCVEAFRFVVVEAN